MATLPRILLKDENIDLLFIYCLMPHQRVISVILGSGMDTSQASEFAQQYIKNQSSITSSLASESGKPVVGGSFCDRTELFVRELQDYGMPVLPSPERAVSALGALYRYSRWLRIFRDGCRKQSSLIIDPASEKINHGEVRNCQDIRLNAISKALSALTT